MLSFGQMILSSPYLIYLLEDFLFWKVNNWSYFHPISICEEDRGSSISHHPRWSRWSNTNFSWYSWLGLGQKAQWLLWWKACINTLRGDCSLDSVWRRDTTLRRRIKLYCFIGCLLKRNRDKKKKSKELYRSWGWEIQGMWFASQGKLDRSLSVYLWG